MTEAQHIDYLHGQIAALKTFCFAVIGAHQDRARLLKLMEGMTEQSTAITLGQPVSEATLQGADAMRAKLLGYARDIGRPPHTAPPP